MNFLFGHYAGSRNATTKAIATLQEIEAMFRAHTPRSVIGPQNLANLVRWRQKLDRGLPQGDYRFTIRDASDLSKVYIYNGQFSKVNWGASLSACRLVFEELVEVSPTSLYVPSKKKPKQHSVAA